MRIWYLMFWFLDFYDYGDFKFHSDVILKQRRMITKWRRISVTKRNLKINHDDYWHTAVKGHSLDDKYRLCLIKTRFWSVQNLTMARKIKKILKHNTYWSFASDTHQSSSYVNSIWSVQNSRMASKNRKHSETK